jgi:hypothetical protein
MSEKTHREVYKKHRGAFFSVTVCVCSAARSNGGLTARIQLTNTYVLRVFYAIFSALSMRYIF